MAGYLMSNDKLREDLAKAKDPEAAAKLLGQHLAKDGKKIGKEVKGFVESDHVKQNVKQMKTYASKQWSVAQKSLQGMIKKGTSSAKAAVKGKKKASKPVMKQRDV